MAESKTANKDDGVKEDSKQLSSSEEATQDTTASRSAETRTDTLELYLVYDGKEGRGEGVYLDMVERERLEILRAKMEHRDPETDESKLPLGYAPAVPFAALPDAAYYSNVNAPRNGIEKPDPVVIVEREVWASGRAPLPVELTLTDQLLVTNTVRAAAAPPGALPGEYDNGPATQEYEETRKKRLEALENQDLPQQKATSRSAGDLESGSNQSDSKSEAKKEDEKDVDTSSASGSSTSKSADSTSGEKGAKASQTGNQTASAGTSATEKPTGTPASKTGQK